MSGGPSVSNLFPAIAQAFAIILLGYLFGLFKIIPPREARAISVLVGKLALPALLFQNLATLNLTTINWNFMAGILIAKASVFLVTVVLTLILTRPFNLGKAGLFGIFATQSNDFALGLPIVQALYGKTASAGQFDYASYIYLLAPISLVIINPVGFLMMEYSKQSHRKRISCAHVPKILFMTLKGVVLNPVIFMTALGVIYNLVVHFGIFHGRQHSSSHNIPNWFAGFLSTLGGAYAACALLQIGIFMVGKIKKLTGVIVMVASLLIFAKTILLPIVADRVLFVLLPSDGVNATVSREKISTFGFLYGTFPTAPTVFVFASQYNIAMEIVASSIVLCTFMSAPIMYVSARLVLISQTSVGHYAHIILQTRRDVTAIALVGLVWVYLLFVFARRYRSYLHVFIMHYMVALVLEVIGGELLNTFTDQHQIYWQIFSFALFFPGVLASRLWTAWLAVGLTLVLVKGPRVAEKAWLPLMLSAWGIPAAVTMVMVLICTADPSRIHKSRVDVTFLFGNVQLVVSIIVLVFSFVVGVVFLVVSVLTVMKRDRDQRSRETSVDSTAMDSQQRTALQPSSQNTVVRRTAGNQMGYGSTDNSSASQGNLHNSTHSMFGPGPQAEGETFGVHIQDSRETEVIAKDELKISDTSSQESDSSIERTPLLLSAGAAGTAVSSRPATSRLSRSDSPGGEGVMRFIVLLLFLLFSCLVGVLIVFWKLINSKVSGIFIGVNVLDTITNFGQGFFVFIVFGFEKHWFWTVLYKKLRRLLFKIETVQLPMESELSLTVKTLCLQFQQQHLAECKEAIVSDKRFYMKMYEGVFTGSDFVDWLVEKGLVRTREDGAQYGHSLLLGRVISHVTEEHYFYDDNYFYRFTV